MKKVVTIGGGTGQYTLLSGLKEYPLQITAIVSMADDGGSTGLLRDELGVLPPGDVRKCLVALSNESELLRALFSYRFTEGSQKGHAFGNLFLSALEKITGSFSEAVAEASRVLRINGSVIPVTLTDTRLIAHFNDGTQSVGEYILDGDECVRRGGLSHVSLTNPAVAHPDAIRAIREADVVVIGPGGLHGSILPCLLVDGISDALQQTQARILYVTNLSNKKGVTDHFTIKSYVDAIQAYLGKRMIDTVLANTQLPSLSVIEQYEARYGDDSIVLDAYSAQQRLKNVIGVDLLSDKKDLSFLRHDPEKLAAAIVQYVHAVHARGRSK